MTNPVRFGALGRVYFGTVPAEVDKVAAIESPFGGCIGDVTFNGIVINFENVAEGRDAIIGQCSGLGKDIISKGKDRLLFALFFFFKSSRLDFFDIRYFWN